MIGERDISANAAQRDGRSSLAELLASTAWISLLALCAITPLLITNISWRSSQYVSLTLDAVSLPKAVAILFFSGLGLGLHLLAVALGGARLRYTPLVLPIVATTAWAALATLTALSSSTAVFGAYQRNEGLAAYVGYLLVFVLCLQVVNSVSRLRTLALVIAGSASLASLYGLAQYVGLDPLVWPRSVFGSRMFATFGNPDHYAAYLVFPLGIALGLALSEKERSARFWIASGASLLVSVGLLLSLVRGAWIGALIATVAVLVAWRVGGTHLSAQQKWLLLAAGMVAAGCVLVSFANPQEGGLTIVERVSALLLAPTSGSVAERLVTWRIGLKAWLARPVLGFGPDNFRAAFLLAANGEWWRGRGPSLIADNAHNSLIQTLVTLGIPGMFLYASAWIAPLVGTARLVFRRAEDSSQMLLAGFWAASVGIAAALMTGVTTPMVSAWLWVGVGSLAATRARPVEIRLPSVRAVVLLVGVLSIACAGWGLPWLYADNLAARASESSQPTGGATLFDRARSVNAFSQEYWIQGGSALETAWWAAVDAGAPSTYVRDLSGRTIEHYSAAAQNDPTDYVASIQLLHSLNQRYELYQEANVASTASSLAGTLLARWPDVPNVANEVARARLHVKDPSGAETNARHAVTLDPSFSYAWLTLGEALLAQGDRSGAFEAMRKAVELDPSDPDAANKLKALEGTK